MRLEIGLTWLAGVQFANDTGGLHPTARLRGHGPREWDSILPRVALLLHSNYIRTAGLEETHN